MKPVCETSWFDLGTVFRSTVGESPHCIFILESVTGNASEMTTERRERLTKLLEQEKAELAAEERARAKSKGVGDFLSLEQKKVFGGTGGIEDRIRRGRGQMHVDAD